MAISIKISYKQYIDTSNTRPQKKKKKKIIQIQGYLIGLLKSNVKCHCERPRNLVALKKGFSYWHLPFSRSYGVATYFMSKIRKLYKLQHIFNNTPSH